MTEALAEVVAEVSWETCNKVGGIYTVISSKATQMRQYYKEYFLVGPYIEEQARFEFTEEEPPASWQGVFGKLAKEGIVCHYGRWEIKGEPKVVLLDTHGFGYRKDDLKGWFWREFHIDSIRAGWDFEEPMLWAYAAGRLIELLSAEVFVGKRMIGHFHEWLAGFGLLYLRRQQTAVRSVFTTHATMLGRTIAAWGEDLYGLLDRIDPKAKAYEMGVQEKFTTELACAKECDIFTTVSEITALEAERLLGRKPEVCVLNGFDMEKFPTIEETSIKHVTSRERLREFLSYYFFPYYHNFNLEHNLMMCTSGRYEYHNKGMDVFIDALGRLNEKLKSIGSTRTITVFFWVPSGTRGIKRALEENRDYYYHIKNYVEWHGNDILKKIIHDFVTSDEPERESVYTKDFMKQMKRDVLHFKRQGNPPLSTHEIINEEHDPIVQALLRNGLDNFPDDPIKVVVYPIYLDGNDSLADLSYYDAIAGTHFAIFPSYYEPWGYTPLESAAMGVTTLTTNLAGFGRFMEKHLLDEESGIYVVDRHGKSYEETVQALFEQLYRFSMLDHSQRVQNKINAKQLSMLADWQHMIKFYVQAHNLALEKPRQ